MTEYTEKEYREKFHESSCPKCLSRKVEVQIRTKGGMAYKIYICNRCRGVIKREVI